MKHPRATWKIDTAVGAAIALCAASVYWLGILPAAESRLGLRAAQTRLGEEQDRANTSSTSVAGARRTVADLERRLHDQEIKLRPASDINEKLATLAAAVKDSGLKVLEIVPDDPREGRRFTRIPVRLRAVGGYAACEDFLTMLNREMPDVGVEFLKLQANHDAGAGDLQVTLLWYAAPVVKPAAQPVSAGVDAPM